MNNQISSIPHKLNRPKVDANSPPSDLSLIRQLVDLLPCAIFWKDINSTFLGCNQHFAKLANLSHPDQIIGKTDYDCPWSKVQSDNYRTDDLQVMHSKVPRLNIEENITLPNGDSKTIQTSKVPLLNQKGEVYGVLCLFIDITEQKHKQKLLQQAKLAAEQADKTKMQFILNMQHDIRTPLSGISGLAKMLSYRESNHDKKASIDDIAKCSEELMNYFNAIFEHSKAESGELSHTEKPFNLIDTIKSVVRIEQVLAKQKKLKLIVDLNDNLPKILLGDEMRLRRILINLVSNAIKFTHDGEVAISASSIKGNSAQTKIIRIDVRDTGIGIPEEQQGVIYERFTRGTASYKGIYKGRGLGLRLVKKFIHDLDGEIHVDSAEGRGSTFTILIPFRVPLCPEMFLAPKN